MPIRVDCRTCRKWYKAPEKVAGSVVKCPGCGGELKVPLDAPVIPATPIPTAAPKASKPSPPAPAIPAPKPSPDLPPLDDDDPFAAAGFSAPATHSSTGAQTAPAHVPPPRPPAKRKPRSSGGAGVAGLAGNAGRFVAENPLVTTVGTIAGLMLVFALSLRNGWFGFGSVMALVGFGLVALGLLVPPPKPRPAKKSSGAGVGSLFNPFAAGGIGLLGALGAVARVVGRMGRGANNGGGGGAKEVDPMAVAIGLGILAAVIGGLIALVWSIRRYGLYRTLAPVYVAFGGLLVLLIGLSHGVQQSRFTRPGEGFGRQVPNVITPVPAEAGAAVVYENSSLTTPRAAGPITAQIREASPLPGISRRSVTIEAPSGVRAPAGRIEVYEPIAARGAGQERQWPCVLLAPAGSNLLAGRDLGDGDHPEALPWAEAGYVVVQYSLAGALPDGELTAQGAKEAYASFTAARAGLAHIEQVLAWISRDLPEVDPRRIAAVGHSSAGTLALLAGESNPSIKACVAFAPCVDVSEFHRENFPALEPLLAGVRKFCADSSPIEHVGNLQCPLFFFQADDDRVTPLAGAVRFLDAAKAKGKERLVEFTRVPTGDHYQSMIDEGIPRAIRWLDATFARATAPRPTAPE